MVQVLLLCDQDKTQRALLLKQWLDVNSTLLQPYILCTMVTWYLSICLSVCLSVCLSSYLSIHLSGGTYSIKAHLNLGFCSILYISCFSSLSYPLVVLLSFCHISVSIRRSHVHMLSGVLFSINAFTYNGGHACNVACIVLSRDNYYH